MYIMKTSVRILIALLVALNLSVQAQNIPDVNLHFNRDLVNCPVSPQIETPFSLSSADGITWDVGFIMLTLTVNENVLGTPPQVVDAPAGWSTDVYKQGSQWQIELVDPNGGGVSIGNNPVDVFTLNWNYIQEGATYSINIDDADLGVNNSLEDEQLHYPGGLFISGSDDCASQVGEIDYYWFNPILENCPRNPTVKTPIQFASHNPTEIWENNFVQLVIQQDNSILGQPRIVNALPGWSTDVYAQGGEWVIEVTSAISESISVNPTTFFELEWDYLQEGMPFAIVLNDIDLGLNVPNEIVHRANGNVISGNAQCPCSVEIINISSTCVVACESKGTVFFDIDIHNGPGGNFTYTIGHTTKTFNLPAGDIIILDETARNISFRQQPLVIEAKFTASNCGVVKAIPTINCGPCNIQIDNIKPSSCDIRTNTYDVEINLTTQALCSGVVYVQIDGGANIPFVPVNNKIVITDLDSDGKQHTVTISDDQLGISCSASRTYGAPSSCKLSSTTTAYPDPVHASLSPNPVTSQRQVRVEAEVPLSDVSIFSMEGREMLRIPVGRKSVKLNVSDFLPGMYIVVLATEEGRSSRKLIIK